ncbi:MAG: HAMP domain-containing protein [Acidobacteriota bacterium]|nr:MAG: HAMP domain-containing protein [Acidobacteriota bacterium]
MKRLTLRRRLYWVLIQWFLILAAVLGVITLVSFTRFRQRASEERVLLADTIARSLDHTISSVAQQLSRFTQAMPAVDATAVNQLHAIRFQSPFRMSAYILDQRGLLIASDPAGIEPIPAERLPRHETVSPLLYKNGAGKRPYLAFIQPFERGGSQFFLVLEMNPEDSIVAAFLSDLASDPSIHVVVVDEQGLIIAAADRSQLFEQLPEADEFRARIGAHRPFIAENRICSFCAEGSRARALTVMVPLRLAPWGVVVQQHKSSAYAAYYVLERGFVIAGGLLALIGLLLSRALTKSVVAPIQKLSDQAQALRRGDLSRPISIAGDFEIELLAGTLDDARTKLDSTLHALKNLNEDLEGLVEARTEDLAEQYQNLRLLHAVSLLSSRERDVERLIPRMLALIVENYELSAVALETAGHAGEQKLFVHPADFAPAWLKSGEEPPADWCQHEISHRGEKQAVLYMPRMNLADERVMEALKLELALSLRGAYLWRRTLAQDEQRRALVRRLLRAGEEERTRIARELHDEISQLLTVVKLSLDDVPADTPEMRKEKQLLSQTQKEIHRIIYDLRPSSLDDLGLSTAIRAHVENYLLPRGLEVSVEIEELRSSRPEVEITVFRIYQEIVTNILRHSNAESVSIELYESEEKLLLAVEDDGVGFDPSQKAEGAGIVGMRERAALVGGKLSIDSEPGMGTHVVLEIPIEP